MHTFVVELGGGGASLRASSLLSLSTCTLIAPLQINASSVCTYVCTYVCTHVCVCVCVCVHACIQTFMDTSAHMLITHFTYHDVGWSRRGSLTSPKLGSNASDRQGSDQEWDFKMVREVVTDTSATVLGEISYNGVSRQCWGMASVGDSGVAALEAASSRALASCLQLFPELQAKTAPVAASSRAGTPSPLRRSHNTSWRKGSSRQSSLGGSRNASFRRQASGNSADPDACADLAQAVSRRFGAEATAKIKDLGSFRASQGSLSSFSNRRGSFRMTAGQGKGAAVLRERGAADAARTHTNKGAEDADADTDTAVEAGAKAEDGPCVLIADDEPVNRKMAHVSLRRAGMVVAAASDGIEAVRCVQDAVSGRRRTVDLILMDMKMKEMDGNEAAAKIRQLETEAGVKHVPIIALSGGGLGHSDVSDHQIVYQAGMQGLILKPLTIRSFPSTLAQIMFHYSATAPTVDMAARASRPTGFRPFLIGEATLFESDE